MFYDIAVIGGGPAGLLAAGRAAELKRRVILLEKNKSVGRKLLTTGGGRCNITNNILDPRLLAANFGPTGNFLISAFVQFGAPAIVNFLETNGVRTKIEKNNQVFPVSNRALDVLNVLLDYLHKTGVQIKTDCPVKRIIIGGNKIEKIILADGGEIIATNYIIATGGKSYPLTGSTGDGYGWLSEMGHHLQPLRPALTPILVKENFIGDLEGSSFDQIGLKLYDNSTAKVKLIAQSRGDIIFTAYGLSGPAALDLSRSIKEESLPNLFLEIDFFPDRSLVELEQHFQTIINQGHKLFKNSLRLLISPKLTSLVAGLTGIAANRLAPEIAKKEKQALLTQLKHFRLSLRAVGGYDQAIITAGGLDLREVDPKTMRSKKIANLFVAGEVLDLAGPTGGYNLQLCWSTGYVAGEAAAKIN